MLSEWRKHQRHMTKGEIKYIRNIINNNTYKPSEYCQNRINQRHISNKSISIAIRFSEIIEFHYKDESMRVLLRSVCNENNRSCCVVLDLTNNAIVTVYTNDYYDDHDTLHNELYIQEVDLLKYLGRVS